jgi:hypothetical protein
MVHVCSNSQGRNDDETKFLRKTLELAKSMPNSETDEKKLAKWCSDSLVIFEVLFFHVFPVSYVSSRAPGRYFLRLFNEPDGETERDRQREREVGLGRERCPCVYLEWSYHPLSPP